MAKFPLTKGQDLPASMVNDKISFFLLVFNLVQAFENDAVTLKWAPIFVVKPSSWRQVFFNFFKAKNEDKLIFFPLTKSKTILPVFEALPIF